MLSTQPGNAEPLSCAHCTLPLFATIDWPADGIDVCQDHLVSELETLQRDQVTGHSWGERNIGTDFPHEYFKVTLWPAS